MRRQKLNGFKNYSGFFTVLVAFYIVLMTGLIVLRISSYNNNKAFTTAFDLVAHTRSVLESTDSMSLQSQNLWWESRNYALTADSNAYRACILIRGSLHKKATGLIKVLKGDSQKDIIAETLEGHLQQLIKLTDSSFQNGKTAGYGVAMSNGEQEVALSNVINEKLQLIKAEEKHLLATRRAIVFKMMNITQRMVAISNILLLILLTGSFVFIFYHFRIRQKTERKLIQSENRFRTLINGTKDLAIFMVNKDGIIMNWYEGGYKIKGYTAEEVIGKPISIFYLPEDVANGEPERNLQIAADRGTLEMEGWRVRKDGSIFWADVLITAIYDKDNKLEGFTKVTRDFTLHKKAEDESLNALKKEQELNEMKSNFVSMASHEFRTPLSTILSSVSLMQFYKTTETQDKRDKHIHRIKSAVNELVETLEEFLSLEKIEEGKIQVRNEKFNLQQLSNHICLKFNADQKKGQTIEYEHTGNGNVYLDQGFLNHILTNLISNAIKYSPENTTISFRTIVQNSNITIIVKDHGIGISAEDKEHLFERFFRASNTGNIKGTGLGLHIVKRYVDLLGGTINVKSEINEGSEFTVTFEHAG